MTLFLCRTNNYLFVPQVAGDIFTEAHERIKTEMWHSWSVWRQETLHQQNPIMWALTELIINVFLLLLLKSAVLLFLPYFCFHAEVAMNEVIDPLHGICSLLLFLYASLTIFQSLTAYLRLPILIQFGSFARPAVMGVYANLVYYVLYISKVANLLIRSAN